MRLSIRKEKTHAALARCVIYRQHQAVVSEDLSSTQEHRAVAVRALNNSQIMSRPTKRARLLTAESDSESIDDGIASDFKINTEFAKRFEHNEKRKELHQCMSLP